ncbi:MAG: aromatic amino acid lyase, partial [Anaerolineae bacterium]|nr:aromatic amino acid lyase [Anaerolineae bacterium]
MITLRQPADLTWEVVEAVAYDHARLEIDEPLLVRVEQGRADFLHLIDQGVPCYGVTTGLGALANTDLTDAERADLPHNMLRARAAAIGPPLPKPVARA